jgi:hypothetical protein
MTKLTRAALALTLLACAVDRAAAHNPAQQTVRELVRIQGYRSPAPRGTETIGEATLVVLGESIHFATTDWAVYALSEMEPVPTPAQPPLLSLQGERPLLRRVATAHADQRVTILAERRPGGGDLFLLNVDLCPEK